MTNDQTEQISGGEYKEDPAAQELVDFVMQRRMRGETMGDLGEDTGQLVHVDAIELYADEQTLPNTDSDDGDEDLLETWSILLVRGGHDPSRGDVLVGGVQYTHYTTPSGREIGQLEMLNGADFEENPRAGHYARLLMARIVNLEAEGKITWRP